MILLSVLPVDGVTPIAGDLPKEITADKSPYLVESDIMVPSGRVVRVSPGVVFLFKNFTGLHVLGVLSVQGTSAHPVIFTSSNDTVYSEGTTLHPTPYDWNGIYIQKDGMGTEMSHFKLQYSVKGIVSETKFISITAGFFNENGRSDCVIESEEKKVEPGKPFSHAVSVKDATIDGVPVKILRDPQALRRTTVRYTGLTLMVGGVALGGISGLLLHESRKNFIPLQSTDSSNTIWNDDNDYQNARYKYYRDLAGAITGAVLTIIGSVGFYWTFTF